MPGERFNRHLRRIEFFCFKHGVGGEDGLVESVISIRVAWQRELIGLIHILRPAKTVPLRDGAALRDGFRQCRGSFVRAVTVRPWPREFDVRSETRRGQNL